MPVSQGPVPRPEVLALVPDSHGGPDYAELQGFGRRPEDVLDFSASTNAFGPPPEVREALAHCDVTRYPDRHGEPLRSHLAEREGVPPDQVLLANGAAQLIWSLAMAYLRPGDVALINGPTFGEYWTASALMGARIEELRSGADQGFQPNVAALSAAAGRLRPRVAWLCNPNNPSGAYLPGGAVQWLVSSFPDTLWVIDEAYRPFVTQPWDSGRLLSGGNVVLLRSLTKDCALPGLRLGYALAAAAVAGVLGRVQPPWSVSSAAITAGLAALRGQDHVRQTIRMLRDEAARLREAITRLGWHAVPSTTHFFLVRVGDAGGFRARLLRQHGIQVRDCRSFGLPDYIRIAARTAQENGRLCRALEEFR